MSGEALWALSRATGVVSLVLFTAALVLGMATSGRAGGTGPGALLTKAGVQRLLQTYDEGALGTRAEAITLESKVSSAWLASRGDSAAEVESRRQEIVERGRDQAG